LSKIYPGPYANACEEKRNTRSSSHLHCYNNMSKNHTNRTNVVGLLTS
jgi:hypothetical protein